MELGENKKEPIPAHQAIERKEDIGNLERIRKDLPIVIFGDAIEMAPATIVSLLGEKGQHHPIIYVTRGPLQGDDRVAFYNAGGYALITKDDVHPNEASEKYPSLLRKKIRAAARQELPKEIFEHFPYPDFFIDTRDKIVKIAERDVTLTHVEFRIVATISSYRGAVIPRSIFLEQIADEVAEGSLISHIHRINKKIAPYHIEPVRNKGMRGFRLVRSE